MKMLCFGLALWLSAAAQAGPHGVSGTVQVGPLLLDRWALSVMDRPKLLRVMLDLYPYREKRAKLGAKFQFREFSAALIKGPILQAYPAMKAFKVDLVEVTARDEYDLPAAGAVKILWQGSGILERGKVSFSK